MEGFGYLNCYQLIKINEKYNCEWNKLLLRYKVRGDLLCLSVQIIYNFTSWLTVESVAECSLFWYGWSNASRIVPICYKIIVFCGPCLLTYNFYRIAIPMFKCRREDSREMLVRGWNSEFDTLLYRISHYEKHSHSGSTVDAISQSLHILVLQEERKEDWRAAA